MTTYETTAASRFVRLAAQKGSGPLGALGSISTVVMMIAITADVVSRNITDRSVPGLLELSGTLLVATVFLGLSYAGVANAHVSVDLITSRFPVAVSRRLAGLMWLLGAGMTGWFIYATAKRALASFEMREISVGLVDWPLWPARWIIVIGLVAFLLVALANGYLGLRGEPLLGEDEDEDDFTGVVPVGTIHAPTQDTTEDSPRNTEKDS